MESTGISAHKRTLLKRLSGSGHSSRCAARHRTDVFGSEKDYARQVEPVVGQCRGIAPSLCCSSFDLCLGLLTMQNRNRLIIKNHYCPRLRSSSIQVKQSRVSGTPSRFGHHRRRMPGVAAVAAPTGICPYCCFAAELIMWRSGPIR